MPISLGFWEWGCPYHCNTATHSALEVVEKKRLDLDDKKLQQKSVITTMNIVLTGIQLCTLIK